MSSDQPTTGPLDTYYIPPAALPDRPKLNEHTTEPWVLRHPGFALSIAGVALVLIQWMGTMWLQGVQAPERKKADADVRRIGRDIRTLATYQLESARSTRGVLKDLAAAHGIEIVIPLELKAAETAARKLRNR